MTIGLLRNSRVDNFSTVLTILVHIKNADKKVEKRICKFDVTEIHYLNVTHKR